MLFQRILPGLWDIPGAELGLISFLALIILFVYYKAAYENRNHLVEVELCFFDGRRKRVVALIDTGNSLVEPVSKTPVSLIWEEVLADYKSSLEIRNFRIIPFSSVGEKKGLLEGYFIDEIIIYGKRNKYTYKKPVIGLTKEELSEGKSYQMILHPNLISEQEAKQ